MMKNETKVTRRYVRHLPTLRDLPRGTLFQYLSGNKVYMVVDNNVGDFINVIQLDNGNTWDVESNKQVDTLLPGDSVTLMVSK